MARAKVEVTKVVTLELTEGEAKYLLAITQNPIAITQNPILSGKEYHEEEEDAAMSCNIFNALSDVITSKSINDFVNS